MSNFSQEDGAKPEVVSSSAVTSDVQEKNKALARKFYEKVWFSNHPEVVDEIVAAEYVVHDIGDVKGVTEEAAMQKDIAGFFWQNGEMNGRIDFQIAEGDLVATRWQWEFQPTTWWMRLLSGKNEIPIINVFRFKEGKIVEIWNHRHDIDTFQGEIPFYKGLIIGILPGIAFAIILLLLWRKNWNLRRQLAAAG